MFKPVPLSKLEGQEFVPQAVLDRPTSHFKEALNIPFVRGHDDFDEYEAAAIELNGFTFELKRYAGYPANSTTIYLPYYVDNLEAIEGFLRAIFAELGVPQNWVSWRRSDDPTL
jgi:hypothetical protein